MKQGSKLLRYVKVGGTYALGPCTTNATGAVVHYGGTWTTDTLALEDGDNLVVGVDLPNGESSAAKMGTITVRFRATGDTGKMPKTVAVCTVKSTSAYAAPAKYEFANGSTRVGHLRFNGFAARDNGDNTTTVYANFIRTMRRGGMDTKIFWQKMSSQARLM